MPSDRKASHPVEVPAWFALACYQKSQVWVENMAEPVSMPDAMRQPEWEGHWRPAIEKEIIDKALLERKEEKDVDDDVEEEKEEKKENGEEETKKTK